jgi:hypothetical protein
VAPPALQWVLLEEIIKIAKNPKRMKTMKNKPDFSVRAHATLRFHGKRIEIGLRIPPDMEQRLHRFLSARFDKK